MPLEIVLEIASYLPDARTTITLSCVSRQLHFDLAGSQFLWFRYGSRKVKKFRKFDWEFDYHGYILDAIAGKIKANCQVCLEPGRGYYHKMLNKTVCMECMNENVVLAEAVNKIPQLDKSKLRSFTAHFYAGSYKMFQGGCNNSRVVCYWLPLVRRVTEAAYGLSWEQATATHLNHIRPLVSPNDIRIYYNTVAQRIMKTVLRTYKRHFAHVLRRFITTVEFYADVSKYVYTWRGRADAIHALPVPTSSQTDHADRRWVRFNASIVLERLLGQRVRGFGFHVRKYCFAEYDTVKKGILREMRKGGKRSGMCGICSKSSTAGEHMFAKYGNVEFNSWEFMAHVQHYHPDRLLMLDAEWRIEPEVSVEV
ncbi:hypothetical protein TWF696_009517 [Orbilia brochopaga]|uniref:F-box domain-containing protein n=1 Tax=Orbilia brochopaga TaxID=3140254 RepID=A0AAV9UAT9_9PEZI